MTQSEYMQKQIVHAIPFPLGSEHNGQIRIQIQAGGRKTNWMTLTPMQMRAIEDAIALNPAFYEEEV